MSRLPEGPGGRIPRVLYNAGITNPTPENVAKLSYGELKQMPNFGKRSMDELRAWLKSHGLDLTAAPPAYRPSHCPHCGARLR